MIRAILFDLDNTLLTNSMDRFIPAYLKLISAYAAPHCEPEQFIKHLLMATEAMASNSHPGVTNKAVFWPEFSRLTGLDPATMIPFFARFYQTRFDDLQGLTEPRPEARPLVEWAFRQGYSVVIATNPLFPRVAVERRLAWAGVGVDELEYDLITTYEHSHHTKPHAAYYEQILARLDCSPAEAFMVGDDWELDIASTALLGMKAYWIAPPEAVSPDASVSIAGRGTLADLWAWCRSGRLQAS